MQPTLTVAYVTGRKDCRIEWFLDSLSNECEACGTPVDVLVIDRYAEERDWLIKHPFIRVHAPKPNVWNGPHRLTKEEYFSAASARNSAICLCRTDWLAYVDDLSVLLPGWLSRVKLAMESNYIVLGAYKKVRELQVENGIVKHCVETKVGTDCRWSRGGDAPIPAQPGDLFGCSLAAPLEAFLTVNGWDERCDACGLGSEDSMLGFMLTRNGYRLMYDRQMVTYEADELHGVEKPLKRVIQKKAGREDASWAMLRMVQNTDCKVAPQYWPEGGIRKLREQVLAGEPFPIMAIPDRDWYSGKLLSEL